MRKLLFILLFPYTVFCQCPTSSVILNTQEDVDNFALLYPDCTTLNVSLRIEGADITNLNGLSNLSLINSELLVINNPSLLNFTGLNNVTRILGGTTIIDNDMITSFQGFNNVEFIQGSCQIESNDLLLNFGGLENLDSITDQLFIYFNPSLSDISALENLEYIGVRLVIANSFSLSECSISSICNYLNDPNGFVGIASNNVGCNSAEEILNACTSCLVDNIWEGPVGAIWHNPNNWSLHQIPTDCHHVIIPANSDVTISAGMSALAYTLQVDQTALLETESSATIFITAEN